MSSLIKITFGALLLAMFIGACKKGDDPTPTPVEKDVYVAGYERGPSGNEVAKYWKNGIETTLSDGARDAAAVSVFVNDTEVYAAGWDGNKSVNLWKNGAPTNLTDGTKLAFGKSVFIK